MALDEVWWGRREQPGVKAWLDSNTAGPAQRSVWFTGHGLGAAPATPATSRYGRATGLYTFGSPHVGDRAFAGSFGTPAYRFVNASDPVPSFLASFGHFEHVGTLKYIRTDGSIVDGPVGVQRLGDWCRRLTAGDGEASQRLRTMPLSPMRSVSGMPASSPIASDCRRVPPGRNRAGRTRPAAVGHRAGGRFVVKLIKMSVMEIQRLGAQPVLNRSEVLAGALGVCLCVTITGAHAFPVSGAAWSEAQWIEHCKDVRTSYNPSAPLDTKTLTLKPDDPRFLDFLYWVWANKIIEHQVEQVGGTEWRGPTDGVIFHWAPGSHWETHTVVPFDHAIRHISDEHNWRDTMFKEFFEQFGPVQGVNIKQRLSFGRPPTWAQFLAHVGGPHSSYYRYVFHQEIAIDPEKRTVTLFGGQGVMFEYTFERYLTEIKEVVNDCKAYQFFELYDRYGKGFASKPGWAGQPIPKR